jgi:hypothetical protein
VAHSATQDRARVLPHPTLIESYVRGLIESAEANPERAREIFKRHLGQVILTPKGEGPGVSFEFSGAF